MKPTNLKSKIFLDSSSHEETKEIIELLGFLDGQTTNPTNFSKSPDIAARIQRGEKFDQHEVYEAYKKQVQAISALLPAGSISIEVYADQNTTAEEMMRQGREMFAWIPNAHIKLPITAEGLRAASMAISESMRVNMTLCFNQEQAAAVYAATQGAQRGDVYVSPFIGRLFDRGENGFDLIANVLKMYENGDGHVLILASSVRTGEQFTHALALGTDIITAYFAAIKEWGKQGMPTPDLETFDDGDLRKIVYQTIALDKPWQEYHISHELTDTGLTQFVTDWNSLIKK